MECFVCLGTYMDPRMLTCGHSFCWNCVKGLVETFNLFCPICRSPIAVGDRLNARKNYQLAGIVEELWRNRNLRESAGEDSSEESSLERPLIPIERQVINPRQKLYLLFILLNTIPFVNFI